MRLLRIMIAEVFLVVNTCSIAPVHRMLVFPEMSTEIARRIRTVPAGPTLSEAELASFFEARLSAISSVIQGLFGQQIFSSTSNGWKLNIGSTSLTLQDFKDGITLYGTDFIAEVTASEDEQVVTINIPALPGGDCVRATFYPDGRLIVEATIEGNRYDAQIQTAPADNPSLRLAPITGPLFYDGPVIFQKDTGNWFAMNQIVSFMSRVERAIAKILITDKNGNVITDISGYPITMPTMFAPQLPVANPGEGPVAKAQAIADDLYEMILYVNSWIYHGDPNQVILGGKEAVLAGRFYEVMQKGMLPYPTDPVSMEATEALYEIVRNVLRESTARMPQTHDELNKKVRQIVDVLPYHVRTKLLTIYEMFNQTALTNPQVFTEAGLPFGRGELDYYITSLATVMSVACMIGVMLHVLNTSHDHWEGFLMRTVHLLAAIMYDTRMATMHDFLNQAARFLWGDDSVFELKRRVQVAVARGFSDPVLEHIAEDVISRTRQMTDEVTKAVQTKSRPPKPIVPLPTSPGGVATMAASHQYSRGDLRFFSLLNWFLLTSTIFPESWGLQSQVPALAVGATVCLGIYMLFTKVITPFTGVLKMGGTFREALGLALKGIATIPKEWAMFQAQTIIMPYLLAKTKLNKLTRKLLGDKTLWPKRMNPLLPIDTDPSHIHQPDSWVRYKKLLEDFWDKRDMSSFILAFERTMDIIVANAVVPATAGVYGYMLYQLLGPAWMWIGFPQIYGWLTFPISLNTWLKH